MTAFPAARCHECGEFLSPQGSRKYAEEALEAHRGQPATRNHGVTIFESEWEWKRSG